MSPTFLDDLLFLRCHHIFANCNDKDLLLVIEEVDAVLADAAVYACPFLTTDLVSVSPALIKLVAFSSSLALYLAPDEGVSSLTSTI